MNKLLSLEKRQWTGIAIATIVSFLFVVTIASAVTTIGANISTDGTLSVTGTSTFDGNLILVAGTDITFTGATGTNDITLTDSLADALSITRGGTDMMVFDSSTPRITFTPVVTLTGATTFNDNLILPAETDLTFTGATGTNDITLVDNIADALSIVRGSTDFMVFNTSTPLLTITPAVTITGALTLGGDVLFTQDNPEILGGDTNGVLIIGSGATNILGGSVRLYGDTHGSLAQDIEFYADATLVLSWDESDANWDFDGENVVGVGAFTSTSLLNAGDLDMTDGGTVTQATSKSTGVTLNTHSGQITMNGAALAAGVEITFTITNSTVAATDVVIANHGSAGTAAAYTVEAHTLGAGSFQITVSNVSAGSLSEAIVINFVVIGGSAT